MGDGFITINPFSELYEKCYSSTEPGSYPIMVDVELTNTCNFSCEMCPVGNDELKRPQGFMSDKTWRAVLNELDSHKTPVRFVRWGEPTLHPLLYEYITDAKHHGLLAHLTTNGSKLDIELTCRSGLDSIKFSAHNWRGVFDVAKELFQREVRPFITVSGYESISIPDGCCDDSMCMEIRDLSCPSGKYYPCPEVFSKLSVDWDGKVTACCGDYNRKMVVGDIHENTLAEIWNCDKLNRYRKMLSEMRHAELPLCRNCVRSEYK